MYDYTESFQTEYVGLTWGIAIAIFLGSMGGTFLVAGSVMWHKWYYEW